MRYLALACDFDATLAWEGRVQSSTLSALEEVRTSGRKLILVTGRELEDLLSIFPQINLFDRVIAENGALLYRPNTKEEKLLTDPPPENLLAALQERSIPFSKGKIVLSTSRSYDTALLRIISDLGLEHQVIFNKGSAMVLPGGITKATGLLEALHELGLSPHNVVGIGDAENDHALLSLCECSVAVANALPALKARADIVTEGEHGFGVIELVNKLRDDDLQAYEDRLKRHFIAIGTRDGEEIYIKPSRKNFLIAGTSGSGKSTLGTAILERLAEAKYQFCVIDPEGDYETFEPAVALGSSERAPSREEVLDLLKKPETNVIVNLVALPLADRPRFFGALLPQLQQLRGRTGRPHWVMIDETHHLLPSSWDPATLALSPSSEGMIFITVHPEQVAVPALSSVDIVMVIGNSPQETLTKFTTAIGLPPPSLDFVEIKPGEALIAAKDNNFTAEKIVTAPSRSERRRHKRKYAEGELPPERSFYFKGPDGKFNLRAQNLILFLQIADGIDDATWVYHLHEGDYSRWFREAIKDEGLARDAARVEAMDDLPPVESRRLIKGMIEERYTLAA